jgi:hypothetical protein
MNTDLENDFVIQSLKKRYFDVIKKEEIGKTPELTDEADRLEKAIKELKNKPKSFPI